MIATPERKIVNSETLRELAKRVNLYDGLITTLSLTIPIGPIGATTQALVVTRVFLLEGNGPVNLTWEFDGVTEFCAKQDRRYIPSHILSYGISVGFFERDTYVDFRPYPDQEESTEHHEFCDSEWFFAAKNVFVSESPASSYE